MLVNGIMKILDMDEKWISSFKAIHKEALEVCLETKAILDLATSDVVIYLDNATEEVARRVDACYPHPHPESPSQKGPNRWCLH